MQLFGIVAAGWATFQGRLGAGFWVPPPCPCRQRGAGAGWHHRGFACSDRAAGLPDRGSRLPAAPHTPAGPRSPALPSPRSSPSATRRSQPPAMSQLNTLREIATSFESAYRSTPTKLKLLDAFSVCALLTAILQVRAEVWDARSTIQALLAPPTVAAASPLQAALWLEHFAELATPACLLCSLCMPSWWEPSPSTPSWPASSAASAPLW